MSRSGACSEWPRRWGRRKELSSSFKGGRWSICARRWRRAMVDQRTAWIEAALSGCPTAAFQARLREQLERRIRMITTMGVREGFSTVTPYVAVVEVERLISFAKEVFGAVETERTA